MDIYEFHRLTDLFIFHRLRFSHAHEKEYGGEADAGNYNVERGVPHLRDKEASQQVAAYHSKVQDDPGVPIESPFVFVGGTL